VEEVRALRGRLSWPDLLFLAVVVLTVAAQIAVVAPGFFLTRLWEDEAYNLTVPINLAAGHGYASDGILTTGARHLFDYRISTGPVVLLPIAAVLLTGIDPVIGGRLVMALFYAGFLVALWFAGRRLLGAPGGVLAVAIALLFDASRSVSPLQGPTDILGEIPAATGIVLFLLLFQRRPVLAGLMLGLAVQSKTLAVLTVPVALVAVYLSLDGPPRRRLARTAATAGAIAAPTVLFELAQLLALGPARFATVTRQLIHFLRTGGQTGGGSRLVKLEVLLGSWSLPVIIVALVAAAVVVAAAIVVAARRRRLWPPSPAVLPVLAGGGMLVLWLGWWFASMGLPAWPRHPSPVLLSVVPVLFTALVAALVPLVRQRGRAIGRSALAIAAVGAVLLGAGGVRHIAQSWAPQSTLGEQRALAARIGAATNGTLGGFWGSVAPLAVLSGDFPVIVADHAVPRTVPVLIFARDAAPDVVRGWTERFCGSVVFTEGDYTLCEQGSGPSPRA
jgi:hypothetical protein